MVALLLLAAPAAAERTGSGTAADPYVDTYSKYTSTEHEYMVNLSTLTYNRDVLPTVVPTSFRNYPSAGVNPVSMMVFTSYGLPTATGRFTFDDGSGDGRWGSTTLADPDIAGYPGFLILRFDNGAYSGQPLTITEGIWPIQGQWGGQTTSSSRDPSDGTRTILHTRPEIGFETLVSTYTRSH